jgi:hypothetical protein
LVRGILQFIASGLAISFHAVASFAIFVWTLFTNFIKHVYDFCLYHLILKYKAKIPSEDHFLVRRISGPGLSSDYHYLISNNLALMLLEYELETLEMEAYKQQMKNKINTPKSKLLKFYEDFHGVGLQADFQSDKIKSFITTINLLEKELATIEKKYWNNHKMQGKLNDRNRIKMNKNNLALAISLGAKLCESFVPEKILNRLSESAIKLFWERKDLQINDWNGLAIHCYRNIFNHTITIPIEDIDNNGFHLVVRETNINQIIEGLFDGNPVNEIEVDISDAKESVTELPEPDIEVVTPDNLFNSKQYESMLSLNKKSLKKHEKVLLKTVTHNFDSDDIVEV